MASRVFVSANSEHLVHTGSAGVPVIMPAVCTVMFWMNNDNAASESIWFTNNNNTVIGGGHGYMAENFNNDLIYNVSGTSGANATTTGAATTSATWDHACGVTRSDTDRSAFVNGGSEGTSSTSRAPNESLYTKIVLGSNPPNSIYSDGKLSHVATWSVALSDDEIASLAAGAHPRQVRPDALVEYYPLNRLSGNEPGTIAGFDLTDTNTVTYTDDTPPMIGHHILAP